MEDNSLAMDVIADLREAAMLRAQVIRKVLEIDDSDILVSVDAFIDEVAE